ncbi:MAG: hypothetical protein IK055_07945 [Lachnospiraceae bacterium]|nr:hypothetical protein [Lachnospiraceae bacterium]
MQEERVKGGGIKSIVFVILILVGFSATIRKGIPLMAKLFLYEKVDKEALEEEKTRVKEEAKKLDPEGKRIVLTDDYLMVEYKDYYATQVDSNNFVLSIICIAVYVFVFSAAMMILASFFFRQKGAVKGAVKWLIILVLILGGLRLLREIPFFKLPPKPEDVTCKLNEVEILRKDVKTSTSSDDDGTSSTSYTYYIYFNDEDGKEYKFMVTKDSYDSIKVHDTCYIASATSKDETVYYRKFDLDRLYMLPGTE